MEEDEAPSARPAGASPFAPPAKRSVTIAGHQTAISLEPIFWDALCAQAAREAIPVNALIARIDVARMTVDRPPNLASAIRCWLFDGMIERK
ncbi:Ribbon-helix-helix domain-containing protein [Sphingobium faniae]|nr:Ribbon-helix-helix domain-containing protein [Sphingobium faniae]